MHRLECLYVASFFFLVVLSTLASAVTSSVYIHLYRENEAFCCHYKGPVVSGARCEQGECTSPFPSLLSPRCFPSENPITCKGRPTARKARKYDRGNGFRSRLVRVGGDARGGGLRQAYGWFVLQMPIGPHYNSSLMPVSREGAPGGEGGERLCACL